MAKKRLSLAISNITAALDTFASNVIRPAELNKLITEHRNTWRIAGATTGDEVIQYLLKNTKLKYYEFKFPYRPANCYVWGEASLFKIMLVIQPKAYLSHYSAMYVHQLTEQIPKAIYVNTELSRGGSDPGTLQQNAIDLAFRNRCRTSKNFTTFQNVSVHLLNGKKTGKVGVIETATPEGETVRVTNIERTLIDITVRPIYSGGVSEVLKAYTLAKSRVSINKLCAFLQQVGYSYPYHQAIGFYLQRTGVYDHNVIELLKQFDMKFDFYLTHQMTEMEYSPEWRLYYPKGF